MDQMMAVKTAADMPLPYVLVDQQRLDLTSSDTGEMKLSFAPSVWDSELYLVIDLYAAANPVHPGGHVGWWKWPLEIKADIAVKVVKSAAGFEVRFDDTAPQESWKNPDFSGLDEPVIALHVVLRPVISEAVRFDDIIHVYNRQSAFDESEARRNAIDNPHAARLPCPGTSGRGSRWCTWFRPTSSSSTPWATLRSASTGCCGPMAWLRSSMPAISIPRCARRFATPANCSNPPPRTT